MLLLNLCFVLAGFILLIKGGDWLVDGGVAIARWAHLSPMVVGLVVMGFGTSMPELLVSTQAALAGSSGIAIGNVVGSNIANIALILGLTALLSPVPVHDRTLKFESPFMIIASVAFCLAGFSGVIERWMGALGMLLLVAFVCWQIADNKPSAEDKESQKQSDTPSSPLKGLLVVPSMIMLVVGANLLVRGASDIAMLAGEALGVPAADMERIIGLTVVALGTSLPELFASVMAARKGEADMAIGNVVGSVTFNVLCVVGVASLVKPISNADSGFIDDYLIMLGLTVLLWLFMRSRHLLERWEGGVLLAIYAIYMILIP